MLVRRDGKPPLEHGFFRRRAAQVLGQLLDRAAIRDGRGNMPPLSGVAALGEKAAKLVEARRVIAQDGVRVVVDERDRRQYFRKWPACSNSSSPAE